MRSNSLRIKFYGHLKPSVNGLYSMPMDLENRFVQIDVHIDKNDDNPILVRDLLNNDDPSGMSQPSTFWVYKDKIVQVENHYLVPEEELRLRIKHIILDQENKLNRIKREVDAYENSGLVEKGKREHIPESVRLFVWQRDEGKCVECGSKEKLEFDHIIPVVEGGSNTERNIQLLCEECNRKKGRKI